MKSYLEDHRERFIGELTEWLRIPSISADPKYKIDVNRAAEFAKDRLVEAGMEKVELIETKGNAVVYAEKIYDRSWPTVLVYGHYDVQPADPLDLWTSPPFEPEVRDEKIYARGACDDKGQVYMHIKAIELMNKTNENYCNIKVIIEGEEEVGSVNLPDFVRSHKENLTADVILISDTSMIANDVPSITTSLRGLSYVEVNLTGPNRDLHSGIYGGAVANPINVLCELIADLKDGKGRIAIPGFYDDVVELSAAVRESIGRAPFDLEQYKRELNIAGISGEEGFTTLERTTMRPTLDVNGIWGGYSGEGAKTVLPSVAGAKISMRLVPNQNPEKITALFLDFLKTTCPDSVKLETKVYHGGEPYITPVDFKGYRAAARAMKETFGKEPVPLGSGGSIPIVALFERELGLKTILMGFGLDSDGIHSPDEHFGIFNFLRGIETIPLFYKYFREN